jgi:hypothetical protein
MLCGGIKSGGHGKEGCSVTTIVDDRGAVVGLLLCGEQLQRRERKDDGGCSPVGLGPGRGFW